MKAEVKITVGGHPYWIGTMDGRYYIFWEKPFTGNVVVGKMNVGDSYMNIYNKAFNGIDHLTTVESGKDEEMLEEVAKRIYEFRLSKGWPT